MITPIATRFVDWYIPELSTLQDSKVYQLREQLVYMIFHASPMAAVLLCSTSTGLLAIVFFALIFPGSVGKVERGYSDAGFRDRRVPFCSSDIPSIAKYIWLCSVITDSVLRHPH